MPVTHGGVGNQRTLFIAHPFSEFLWPKLVQKLFRAIDNRLIAKPRRNRLRGISGWLRAALGLWMAIDRHISNIGQKLGGAVLPLHMLEQFRRRVDEPRRVIVGLKFWMIDNRFEEGQVRRHTANTELTQSTVHTADRLDRCRT